MEDQNKSFGPNIIQFCNLVPRYSQQSNEFEKIYQLPLVSRYRNENDKMRICHFGYAKQNTQPINILVIGTTGSGKSTAVNALINYLANVGYEDDHRLEIVNLEDSEKTVNKTESQTDWITVYEIGELGNEKMKCQVNIVDTPGFGDTRGKERDGKTVDQIRSLFEHYLTFVHAVCITVNGTETRLNERQKYIFDSIMKLFGNDIKNNLFIWATFTDAEKPPVLASIKAHGIEYKHHFSFENGALFEKLPEEKRARKKAKGKFKDVYLTLDDFFDKIQNAPPQSLNNSKQVLSERVKLRDHQEEIEVDIRKTLKYLEDQKSFERDVIASEEEVVSSKNCSFDVTMKEKCTEKVFNCEVCKITCCDPCKHNIFGRLFYECRNLSWGDYCKICRCKADRHEHSKFQRYTIKKKSLSEIEDLQNKDSSAVVLDDNKKRVIEKAKKYFNKNQKDKMNKEEILNSVKSDIDGLEKLLINRLTDLHNTILKLQQIALYDEKTTVSQILNQIQDNDPNKCNPENRNIYEKLRLHNFQ